MENVVIISETQGFLLSSLREHLEATACNVSVVEASVDKISKVPHPMGVALIYASEELLENQQALIYIRDRSVGEGTAIFLVGSEDEVEEIEKIIPKSVLKGVFLRPINVNAVAQELTDYICEQHQAARKKVLVVDDSGAMLRNVKGWLEDKYQVILANSGTMAIKYLTLYGHRVRQALCHHGEWRRDDRDHQGGRCRERLLPALGWLSGKRF